MRHKRASWYCLMWKLITSTAQSKYCRISHQAPALVLTHSTVFRGRAPPTVPRANPLVLIALHVGKLSKIEPWLTINIAWRLRSTIKNDSRQRRGARSLINLNEKMIFLTCDFHVVQPKSVLSGKIVVADLAHWSLCTVEPTRSLKVIFSVCRGYLYEFNILSLCFESRKYLFTATRSWKSYERPSGLLCVDLFESEIESTAGTHRVFIIREMVWVARLAILLHSVTVPVDREKN